MALKRLIITSVKGPALWRLLRPKQWTKNLLVFAALLFTANFRDYSLTLLSLAAFFVMSLVSSAFYIFNDIRDLEQDQKHPKKKNRPLAAGEVCVTTATAIALVFLMSGLIGGWFLNFASFWIIVCYCLLQVAYNLFLRAVPIADVFCIASGFVLRACLGATAISVSISVWLLFCTGALALLIGFGKRRSELRFGEAARESLTSYTPETLNSLVVIFGTSAILTYGIYSIESQTAHLYPSLFLTAFFVTYGVCRYIFLILSRGDGEEPESLLFQDPHLVGSILLFLVFAVFALARYSIPFLEAGGAIRG